MYLNNKSKKEILVELEEATHGINRSPFPTVRFDVLYIPIKSNDINFENEAKRFYQSLGFEVKKFSQSERIKLLSFNKEVGAPDLIVRHKKLNAPFLIEVKGINDGIKMKQILWYKNNPEILITILFIIPL